MDVGKQTFVLFLSRTKLFPPFPRFLRSSGEFLISWEKWKRKYTTKRRGGYFGKRREYFIARVWMGKTCRVKYLFCSFLYRPHPCTPVPRSSTVYLSVVASKMSESCVSSKKSQFCLPMYLLGVVLPVVTGTEKFLQYYRAYYHHVLYVQTDAKTYRRSLPLFIYILSKNTKGGSGGRVVSHKIPFFPG